jgi:hypothetical protein
MERHTRAECRYDKVRPAAIRDADGNQDLSGVPKVTVLDVLAIWVASIERLVHASGGAITFRRSPGDRLNESAHVLISRGDQEAELILWESGEAEYARVDGDAVNQQHFDDVMEQGLGSILQQLLEVVG